MVFFPTPEGPEIISNKPFSLLYLINFFSFPQHVSLFCKRCFTVSGCTAEKLQPTVRNDHGTSSFRMWRYQHTPVPGLADNSLIGADRAHNCYNAIAETMLPKPMFISLMFIIVLIPLLKVKKNRKQGLPEPAPNRQIIVVYLFYSMF